MNRVLQQRMNQISRQNNFNASRPEKEQQESSASTTRRIILASKATYYGVRNDSRALPGRG